MRYRLLGLDVDGTLLDPQGELPADAREAVAKARRSGLEVVLCTGRRLRSVLPLARELGLPGAVVVNNGVVVKDLASGATLRHAYLPAPAYPEVLALLREVGSPLVYVDNHPEPIDILVEDLARAHPFQREYLDTQRDHFRTVSDLADFAPEAVIMVSLMGDDALLYALRERARERLGRRVRTESIVNKNFQGRILEFVAPGSGKWAALRWVAAQAGIGPESVAAVGDDLNDVEMIAAAGLGIAMGNAAPAVRAAADRSVRGNDAAGVVEAIELVIRAG